MGSALKKLRRKELKRRMPSLSDENADMVVAALRENREAEIRAAKDMTPQIAADVEKKLRNEYVPHIRGEMLLYVIGFLRCEMGYGKKRIIDFIHAFNEFADCMQRDSVSIPELVALLSDECGIDVPHEFQLCEEESKDRKSTHC